MLLLAALVLAGQIERTNFEPTSIPGLAFRTVLVVAYPVLLVASGVIERHEVVVLRNAVLSRATKIFRSR